MASSLARGLLVAVLAVAGAARAEVPRPPRAAMGERQIVILNHTDHVMNEIYISPSRTDAWGEDRLGEATLDSGRSVRLRLGRTRECNFDIQVIYDDASREQQLGHNACQQAPVEFTGATAQLPPAVLGAEHHVVLLNGGRSAIQQVFISPAEASQWGDDLLPNRRISVGEQAEVSYRGACAADLRIVFENRAAEERRGLDLCASSAIIIRPGWTTADTVPGPTIQSVRLTNRSGHSLTEFRLRPDSTDPTGNDPTGTGAPGTGAPGPDAQAAAAPGEELLAGVSLANGQSIDLPFNPLGGCRFTAHAVFQGTDTARDLPGLDLCVQPEITLLP